MLIFGALVSMNAKVNDGELSFNDVAVVSLTFSFLASLGMTCVGKMKPALFSAVGNYVGLTQFVFKHTNLIQMRTKNQKDCLQQIRHVWFCLESSVYAILLFCPSCSESSSGRSSVLLWFASIENAARVHSPPSVQFWVNPAFL